MKIKRKVIKFITAAVLIAALFAMTGCGGADKDLTGGEGADTGIKPSVEVLNKIELYTSSVKKYYFIGDSFSYSGLDVIAVYESGMRERVIDYEVVAPDMKSGGLKTVTVSYGGQSASYEITVENPFAVKEIVITGNYKTIYKPGENFDSTGMTVKVIYVNGQEDNVETFEIIGGEDLDINDGYVQVRYGGKTVDVEITVTNDLNTKILTLDASSDVTFANGLKTYNLLAGAKFPDVLNNTGRDIKGWFYSDNPLNIWTAEAFSMPDENISVIPVFSPADGYTQLEPRINSAYYKDTDYTQLNSAVNGGENGFAEKGRDFDFNIAMKAGKDIRFDITYPVSIGDECIVTYNFENNGDTAITFDAWQVYSSKDTANGEYIDKITLAPGESVSKAVHTQHPKNDSSVLLYVKFNAIVSHLHFGIAASATHVQ